MDLLHEALDSICGRLMYSATVIFRNGLTGPLLAVAAMVGCSGPGDWAAREKEPIAVSSSDVVDLEGRPIDPLVQWAERVVVLTFLRTDCPISNRYAPTIRELSGKFTPRGVSFYLVYPDPDATADEIRTHLQEYNWDVSAVRDPRHALVGRAGATITPEAAVFNRSGELVYHGRIDDRYVDFNKKRPAPTTHDLEDAIMAALADEPVPQPVTEAVGCFIADLK